MMYCTVRLFLSYVILFMGTFCLQLTASLVESDEGPTEEQMKEISLFQGYCLYKRYLQDAEIPYNLEQVIEGMREAERQGEKFTLDEEKLESATTRLQNYLRAKIERERLAEADLFMKNLVSEKGVVELEKGKLYYKRIIEGIGPEMAGDEAPLLSYSLSTVEKGKVELYYPADEPRSVFLPSTISGFSRGVSGMRRGEKRIIYIHPELAYGALSSRLKPNTLLIFEVESPALTID